MRLACAFLAGGCAAPPPAPPAGSPAAAPAAAAAPARALPAPLRPARTWDEYRQRAARQLVERNPQSSHLGPVQQPALAIVVLEIELQGDGSVRRVTVLRQPGQAGDTVQLAIDAVHRAAPYGAVSQLPRPWRYVEVFLFDDARRFKPRTLDE